MMAVSVANIDKLNNTASLSCSQLTGPVDWRTKRRWMDETVQWSTR